MNKVILVTGASGYLANALIPCATQYAKVIGVARKAQSISNTAHTLSVDLTDRSAVLDVVLTEKPDAIIHCAACNPGGTDEDMFAVNEVGTANVAEAARQLGSRLVSVSSDTVFNGTKGPYSDNAPSSPLPQNAYAVSKARGEAQIMALVPSAIIVRTSLIYGTDKIDRGTAGFADRLGSGGRLSLFTDVIRQPVYDKALSQSLCDLALKFVNEAGFINIAGHETISRYAFGLRMLDYWGIDYTNRVDAVTGVGMAGLPLDLTMTMQRAQALGLPTPGVTEILTRVPNI